MAVVVEDWDASVIDLAGNYIRWIKMTKSGVPVTVFLESSVTKRSLRNTLTFGIDVNGVKTIIPTSGVSYAVRVMLADYGFKPDATFMLPGYYPRLRMSRVQDLEDIDALRGEFTRDSRVLSHVVPYVFRTITPSSSGAVNVAETGTFLPYPWPRVLNTYRIVNTNLNRVHWPRGTVGDVGPTGLPKYERLHPNGTMFFPQGRDPGITPSNGSVFLNAGTTYDIEIGHVEPLPVLSTNGGALSNGPQRWPSNAVSSIA